MNPHMKRGSVFLVTAVLLVTVSGCSDEDCVTPPIEGPGFATLVLDQGGICSLCDEGIVFTSSMDGTLLDYATWTGSEVLQMVVPVELGKAFTITRVQMGGDSPYLRLETSVEYVAEDMVLDWRRAELIPGTLTAEFRYENIPDHDRYYLGAGLSTIAGDILPSNQTAYSFFDPSDFLLVMAQDGQRKSFLWIENVASHMIRDVDLAGLVGLERQDVILSGGPGPVRYVVSGYVGEKVVSTRRSYVAGSGTYEGSVPGTLAMDLVKSGFDGFISSFRRTRTVYPLVDEAVICEGGLPGEVTFWAADIDFLETDPDGFRVGASEPVDSAEIGWKGEMEGSGSAWWLIEVRDMETTQVLPQLPVEIQDAYPSLQRRSFAIDKADIAEFNEGMGADGFSPVSITRRVTEYLPASKPD